MINYTKVWQYVKYEYLTKKISMFIVYANINMIL